MSTPRSNSSIDRFDVVDFSVLDPVGPVGSVFVTAHRRIQPPGEDDWLRCPSDALENDQSPRNSNRRRVMREISLKRQVPNLSDGATSSSTVPRRGSSRMANQTTVHTLQEQKIRTIRAATRGSKALSCMRCMLRCEAMPSIAKCICLGNIVFLVLYMNYFDKNDMVYFVVEMCFIVYFIVELGWRHFAASQTCRRFLCSPWNVYDLVILVSCLLDATILLWRTSLYDLHWLLLMLMPFFQILRLGRSLPELPVFIKGFASGMQSVAWAMFFFLLVLYFVSVLVQWSLDQMDHYQDDAIRQQLFGTFGDTLLTMLTVATLEEYPGIIRHFMHDDRGLIVAIALMVSIVVLNLLLLNLVTAAVVDSLFEFLPKKRAETLAKERSAVVDRLEWLFKQLDEDGDERLTLEEFENAVRKSQDVRHAMGQLQLASFDIQELFFLLDREGTGRISVDQFIEGLLRMAPGEATKKDIFGVQHDLLNMWDMLASGQEQIANELYNMQTSFKRSSTFEKQVGAVLGKTQQHAADIQTISQSLADVVRTELKEVQTRIFDSIQSTSRHLTVERVDAVLQEVTGIVAKQVEQNLAATMEHVLQRCLQSIPTQEALTQELVHRLERNALRPQEHQQLNTPMAAGLLLSQADLGQHAAADIAPEVSSVVEASSACAEPEPDHSRSPRVDTPRIAAETLRPYDNHGSTIGSAHDWPQQLNSTQRLIDSLANTSQQLRAQLLPDSPAHSLRLEATLDMQQLAQQQIQQRMQQQVQEIQQQVQWQTNRLQQISCRQSRSPANDCATGDRERVFGVRQWIIQQGLTKLPFDKLVLHLDQIGVQLSIREQDSLKQTLTNFHGND